MGIGIVLQGADAKLHAETCWDTIMFGYGKCEGYSATQTELQAFSWLVDSVKVRLFVCLFACLLACLSEVGGDHIL